MWLCLCLQESHGHIVVWKLSSSFLTEIFLSLVFLNKSLTLNTKLDHGQLRHDVYYTGRLGIKTIRFSCRARHDPALCVTWAGEVEEEGMVWAQVSLSYKVKERCELQASLSYRVRLSKPKQNKTKKHHNWLYYAKVHLFPAHIALLNLSGHAEHIVYEFSRSAQ